MGSMRRGIAESIDADLLQALQAYSTEYVQRAVRGEVGDVSAANAARDAMALQDTLQQIDELWNDDFEILAALPDADLYELGEWGLRRADYDDLDLVRTWRSFLEAPERFLRHRG